MAYGLDRLADNIADVDACGRIGIRSRRGDERVPLRLRRRDFHRLPALVALAPRRDAVDGAGDRQEQNEVHQVFVERHQKELVAADHVMKERNREAAQDRSHAIDQQPATRRPPRVMERRVGIFGNTGL